MAHTGVYCILGLFGPKEDVRQRAYDMLPTYEITDDGFIITVHDLPVADVERGGIIRLRWDEVTSIRPLFHDEAEGLSRQILADSVSAVSSQVERSIDEAMFCEGRKEKPARYMTTIGRIATRTLGLRGTTQLHGDFHELGVVTLIDGPEIKYVVVFRKGRPEDLYDLLGAFRKAKGIAAV